MNRQFYPDRKKMEEQYKLLLPSYMSVLEQIQGRLRTELFRTGVHFTIKYRVKTFPSYYGKLLKRKTGEIQNGGTIPIQDILGTRVVCPFLEDVVIVEGCLREVFTVHEVERKGAERAFSEFGYSSTHLLLEIPADICERFPDLDLKIAEVQVRTFLQDAWAEVEHELIYKNRNNITPMDDPLRRKLAALNANLSLSDDIFQEIRDYQRRLHGELNKRRHSFSAQLDEVKPGLTAGLTAAPQSAKAEKPLPARDETFIMQGGDINGEHHAAGAPPPPIDFVPPEVNSNNKDQLLLSALHAHNEKNYPMAACIYSKILEQEVQPYIKALVLIHRGKAYFSQSNYCEALKDFEAAVECEPGSSRAFYHLGIVHRVLDDNPAALKAFQTCLEINPFHVDTLFAISRVYFDMEDYTGALEYCEKTLLVEPESGPAKEFRKLVLSRMKL